MIQFNNFDKTKTFEKLSKISPVNLKKELKVARIERYEAPVGGGLQFNYSTRAITQETLDLLIELANEQQILEKYKMLAGGAMMNTGEKRLVLHQLSRGETAGPVLFEGQNIGQFYEEQKKRIYDFADKVHNGKIKGSTGKKFDTVVQIGIGGSDLGPRALYLALKGITHDCNVSNMKALFISNVDPDDPNDVLAEVNYETTLFILVSKSGTTQETLTNQSFVLEKMKQSGIKGLNPSAHMIAVTSATSPLAKSKDFLDSFYIDDFIGGRYSSCSAVGGVVLSLAFSPKIFEKLLEGAHEADLQAMETDLLKNGAALDALIGVYERLAGFSSTAVLPYSQALSRFPAHLQQMDMESNGKSVNRDGQPVSYLTGPVIFGEPGTNGQHSFYQLLHQGTDTIVLQFIGFKQSQYSYDLLTDGSTSQQKLNANLAAQIIAFALGKEDSNLNKNFVGNRYCSLIYGDRLTPKTLGALLAHYENKVMFQGFIWNLNSFDQEGVQLGKVLTSNLLKKVNISPELNLFASKLGI